MTKLSTLTKEVREEYDATKLKYAGTGGETPEKMKDRGQKILAVGSPGTPMSKVGLTLNIMLDLTVRP